MKQLFLIGIFASIFIFLIHFYYVGFGVYGDGVGYYSYTHSLYFLHNLDFHDEFKFYSHFTNKGITFSRIYWDITPTKTGLLPNHWSIGPGILWLPFMFLGDIIAHLLYSVGIHFPLDGFSPPYEFIIGVGNILYGYLGLFFLYKFLRNYFSGKISLLAVLSIYLATNLFYYITIEPNLSHGVSFFMASLFLYTWTKTSAGKSIKNYFFLGFIGGLLATIRPYDAVWILIPIGQLVYILFRHPEASAEGSRRDSSLHFVTFRMTLIYVLVLIFSWFIGFSPQLLAQKIIYGYFWYQPYLFEGGGQNLSLSQNYILASLFSLKRGLFFWSPILLLSFIGWWWDRKKYLGLFLTFLLIFLTQWQVIGHWSAALSAGFGARMFISSFPLFAVGLAILYQKIKKPTFILSILIIFTFWNILLLNQFFMDKRLLEGQLTLGQIIEGQFSSLVKLSQKISGQRPF